MDKVELLKLTVPKLREEAMKIEGVVGVHGMNKYQLQALVAKNLGIVLEEKKQHKMDMSQLKAKVRELRAKKEESRKAGDLKWVEINRKRIKRVKRITRNF